jgi:hypothetical protein
LDELQQPAKICGDQVREPTFNRRSDEASWPARPRRTMTVGLNANGSVEARRLQHCSDVRTEVAGRLGVVPDLRRHRRTEPGVPSLSQAARQA